MLQKIKHPQTGEPHSLLLGAHFSIAKGLHHALYEAASYGCSALQIFTKNAGTWRERRLNDTEIQRFKKAGQETGIQSIAAHSAYLINIASGKKKQSLLSCEALLHEIMRCGQLGIPYLVLHPGSHTGDGEQTGIRRIADNLNEIFASTQGLRVRVLLETTAGQGSSIGHRFEHLAAIMEKTSDQSRIGVCLDTCHIFAAGYDISTGEGYRQTINEFDKIIGIDRLYVIHLNDSKREAGSRVDRHEHIGDGFIGLEGFRYLINDRRLEKIPKIIETPKIKTGKDGDIINLRRLRRLQYR